MVTVRDPRLLAGATLSGESRGLYRELLARRRLCHSCPVADAEGRCTSSLALWHSLGLVPVSLLPIALSKWGRAI